VITLTRLLTGLYNIFIDALRVFSLKLIILTFDLICILYFSDFSLIQLILVYRSSSSGDMRLLTSGLRAHCRKAKDMRLILLGMRVIIG
jgi:hypothetical protein